MLLKLALNLRCRSTVRAAHFHGALLQAFREAAAQSLVVPRDRVVVSSVVPTTTPSHVQLEVDVALPQSAAQSVRCRRNARRHASSEAPDACVFGVPQGRIEILQAIATDTTQEALAANHVSLVRVLAGTGATARSPSRGAPLLHMHILMLLICVLWAVGLCWRSTLSSSHKHMSTAADVGPMVHPAFSPRSEEF